jgi:hypothetical protein
MEVQQLKLATKWAFDTGLNIWVLGLTDPIAPQLLLWLTQNFQVYGVKVLPSGTIVLKLIASPQTVPLLRKLPPPRAGGSLHECNWIKW